jgi:thioredoxin-related protein
MNKAMFAIQTFAMKKLLLSVALLATTLPALHADWTTDYKAALAQAKTQNKQVLLDFTGSDWCPYCQMLDKEVLAQQSFKDFADKNYILVTVDFPQQKPLPDDVKSQNDGLQKHFHVDGFPTLLVVDAEGKELGRQTGSNPGSGPDSVITQLKSFTK